MSAEASSSASGAPPSASSTSTVASPTQPSIASPRGAPSTATSISSPRHQLFPPLVPTAPSTTSTAPLSQTLPSSDQQRHVAEARTAVVASISNLLDSELQSRAALLHSNAAALERQERDVVRATDGLRRENDKLAKFSADGARKVKELGNVQYWAEVLEREFLVLEETMRLVRRGSCGSCESGSWSGTASWSGSDDDDGDRRDAGARLDGKDAVDRDVRMDEDTDLGGVKLNEEDLDKGKGKQLHGMDEIEAMQVDFSEASQSAAEAESSNETDHRARGSETTSLSTMA